MRDAKQWRVLELIEWTTGYFEKAGVDAPRLDAELLLAHALGQQRMWLYLNFEQAVAPEPLAAYRSLVKRRSEREPVAYLIGSREFMSIPLVVTPDTLIPRPDTETLVEAALERLNEAQRGLRIADIGTGSGAIAIALAESLRAKQPTVIASDVSEAALAVASKNAEAAGVDGLIEFRCGDLCAAFEPGETFDAILSNPPYIPSAELDALQPEVSRFEPRLALDGGPDGLRVLRQLIDAAATFLTAGGLLALEVGVGQAVEVIALIDATDDFDAPEIVADYGGIDRAVLANRR